MNRTNYKALRLCALEDRTTDKRSGSHNYSFVVKIQRKYGSVSSKRKRKKILSEQYNRRQIYAKRLSSYYNDDKTA